MVVTLSKEDIRGLDSDWNSLTELFPENWEDLAYTMKAVERPLKNFKSISDLLRSLLLHCIQGYSLRETCTLLKESNIVDISDTSLLDRLQRSEKWLHSLCLSLLEESHAEMPEIKKGVNLKLVDSTVVSEPGKTGTQWRVHYSFQLPNLTCDSFEITKVKGSGNGEHLNRYTVKKGDHIIGDRGYANKQGIEYVNSQKGKILVRVNSQSLPLFDKQGKELDYLKLCDKKLKKAGSYAEWEAYVKKESGSLIKGRLCVVKKSKSASKKSKEKLLQKSRDQEYVKEKSLRCTEYIILFTTFTKSDFSTEKILNLYRWRWQIELAFKRLKSLINFGHLPKYSDESSRSWLYAKLFISLVIEKLTLGFERLFFPWGQIEAQKAI